MKINPINNNQTNFQGRFQKTPALEAILKGADKNSLGRFNEIIQRAAKCDDGYVFSFSVKRAHEIGADPIYNLNIRRNTEFEVWNLTRSLKTSSPFALINFIPILEKYYPKTYNETQEELISNIYKNMD